MGNEIFGNSHQSGGSTCRIKTGTYTGDGTTGQAITGVGFQPKYIQIIPKPVGFTLNNLYIKFSENWGDYALLIYANGVCSVCNRINSLDSDGFTVDDGGGDADPNKDTRVYDYMVIG